MVALLPTRPPRNGSSSRAARTPPASERAERVSCAGRLHGIVAPLVRGATARSASRSTTTSAGVPPIVVEMVALRPFRPRTSGRNECCLLAGCTRSLRRWYAALRLAARAVPPPPRRYGSQREPFHLLPGARSASRSTTFPSLRLAARQVLPTSRRYEPLKLQESGCRKSSASRWRDSITCGLNESRTSGEVEERDETQPSPVPDRRR